VWVDMSSEQVFTHNQVKHAMGVGVTSLIEPEGMGLYFADGLLLSLVSVGITVKPDGTFVSTETYLKRIRLIPGSEEGFVEMEGTPDMALEVVSTGSVYKDLVVLREDYWKAGIQEYWLVDARQEPLRFDILRHTAKGYVAVRKQGGWVKSAVFGKSFQLVQSTNPVLQCPQYKLHVR